MQVDFLPAAALTKEAQEAAKARSAALALLTRRVPVDIEGDPGEMQLLFKNTYKTNGGYMFDLMVRAQDVGLFCHRPRLPLRRRRRIMPKT